MQLTVQFLPDGTAQYLKTVDVYLTELGNTTTTRASHILPVHPLKRAAFIALRVFFGERGRVAEWTRQWYGPWEAHIIATGKRFQHASRRVCLAWERDQIES